MEKILIIQLNRMGDLIQTLPLLKRLKQEMADCDITLMCIKEFSEVILNTPLADRLIRLPYRDIEDVEEALKKTVDQVNISEINPILEIPELKEDYDFIINLTHSVSSAVLCENLKSKRKSGRINTYKGELRLLDDWTKYLFASLRNRTQNLFNLVDIYVGMGGIPHKPVNNYLEVTTEAQDRAQEILKVNGYEQKGRLIAFQMGANQLHRAWPVDNFASLANQLMKHTDIEIVLLGSKKEREIGDRFLCRANFPVIDLIGKDCITDLPAIIKQCDLIVSNDTGPMHIAAAVKTRVLGLFFSTSYFTETAPYGENNIIIQAELPCSPCHHKIRCEEMECRNYLKVEAVEQVVRMMLEGKNDLRFDFPDLSVYQSRFLSNGTLIYAPILSSTISEQYRTGFVNRVIWESALGLEHDTSFIGEYLLKMRTLNGFNTKVEECKKGFNYLREQYSQAIRSAQEIIREFVKWPISQAGILSMVDELSKIETNISKLDGSLMKDYHNIEMMDMDSVGYPALANHLRNKYSKLDGIVKSFLTTLKVFF